MESWSVLTLDYTKNHIMVTNRIVTIHKKKHVIMVTFSYHSHNTKLINMFFSLNLMKCSI
jgi:hypothetical protein